MMFPGWNSPTEKRISTPKQTNLTSKYIMQNLYKNQLDQMVKEINDRKQAQKHQQEQEKRQFNERAELGRMNQKGKQIAYKNYYKMLMENQDHHQSSYISPYQYRDNQKQQFINHSVVEAERKGNDLQFEIRKRKMEAKNTYREELLKQIDERRMMELKSRQNQRKEREEYQKYRKMPKQVDQYERQKHIEEMDKYRQNLDKIRQRNSAFKKKSFSEHHSLDIPADQHNALINPLPYNIQNPYLLKQMKHYQEKSKKSNLAEIANQNFNYKT